MRRVIYEFIKTFLELFTICFSCSLDFHKIFSDVPAPTEDFAKNA